MTIMEGNEFTVTIANGAAISSAFTLKANAVVGERTIFLGALIPDIDAGAVGLEISRDGTNFYPVIDPADGSDLVLVASGADPGWIDFSDYVRYILEGYSLRFTSASQTAERTIYVCCRG